MKSQRGDMMGTSKAITSGNKEYNIPRQLQGKIFSGRGGISANKLANKLTTLPTSGVQKEVINRVGVVHEAFEQGIKKKDFLPFAGHYSPKILFKENNLITSLPQQFKPAGDFYRNIRAGSGEASALGKFLPKGYGYGEQRIPKAMQKHVMRKMQTYSNGINKNTSTMTGKDWMMYH